MRISDWSSDVCSSDLLGFGGRLSMPSADADAPCDRPNLSKDYLVGTADEDWIPLQGPEFYAEHDLDLRLGCEATSIDTAARPVNPGQRESLDYGAPLIAPAAAHTPHTPPGDARTKQSARAHPCTVR